MEMETSGPLDTPLDTPTGAQPGVPPDILHGQMVICAVETAEGVAVFEVALDPPAARIIDARDHAGVVAIELGQGAAVVTIGVGAMLLYADCDGGEHASTCEKTTLLRIDMPGALSTDDVAGHILDCRGADDELADEGRTWRHTHRMSVTLSAEREYWHV